MHSYVTLAVIRPGQLYAWRGPSLLVLNSRGDCSDDEPLAGYYFRETRHLRTLRLTIDGRSPWLCEAARLEPHVLAFTYDHPELTEFGGGGSGQSGDEPATDDHGIPYRALSLRLTYTVNITGCAAALTVANHARRALDFELAWHIDADFADLQEAHAHKRLLRGDLKRVVLANRLMFDYQVQQFRYQTEIRPGGPCTLSDSGVAAHLQLEPQQSVVITLRIAACDAQGYAPISDQPQREQFLRDWQHSLTQLTLPRSGFAERILHANIRDYASLPLLEGERDEWLTLQAGLPLYPALFGRDTLTAGWQAACLDCGQSLDASLTRLGRLQSEHVDDWRDAEPGRIPFQVRQGPLALTEVNPFAKYYADFASPLMFVISLAHLYSWTGDTHSIRRHWDVVRRIMEWARTFGDRDGDGYLEYETRSPKGPKNQGWKDSGDAVVYEDGRPVPAPIATCELQGYWFAAQQLMGFLSAAVGEYGNAKALWQSASELKTRFNRDWWDKEEGSVVLALDPDKRPVRAVTSNIGHCVTCGIISADRLPAVVGRLFAPDMFSGWGIRTLSSLHRAYNPLSYHRGTVWAVEQATIAFGLRRFGFNTRAVELARSLFDLAAIYPEHRIPECIGGYARYGPHGPGAYPRANTPQLWNASAFPLLVHTLLGFQPVGPLQTLVVDPVLPTWLPEIVVENLRLGRGKATLRFWRDGRGCSHVQVLSRRGTFRVIKQPPVESLRAGVFDRLSALFDTVRH